MNLWSELDSMTAPEFAASPVRTLSREEIEALQESGAITPVEEIPAASRLNRQIYPERWFGGRYFRYARR